VTADAFGTAVEPVPISTTFVLVALKFVCAIEISLLARSYTRYAERMKVSPMTGVLEPAGAIPKRHAAVPSEKVSCRPFEEVTGITSSSMVTEIVGVEKVKFKAVVFEAKEHGTYAAPADESYCASTCSKMASVIALGR
jgi:hypothetical protein